LTGEVELLFKSESFPIRRFAGAGTLDQIRSNTPNPDENPDNDGKSANPFGEITPSGGTEPKYPGFQSPLMKDRQKPEAPEPIRKLGELPEVRKPVEPDPVKQDLLSEKNRFSPERAEEIAKEKKAKSDKGDTAANKDGESGQPEAGSEDEEAGSENKEAGSENKEAGGENQEADNEKKNEAPAKKKPPVAKGKE
jgi:hypothetical protein